MLQTDLEVIDRIEMIAQTDLVHLGMMQVGLMVAGQGQFVGLLAQAILID